MKKVPLLPLLPFWKARGAMPPFSDIPEFEATTCYQWDTAPHKACCWAAVCSPLHHTRVSKLRPAKPFCQWWKSNYFSKIYWFGRM